MRYKDFNGPVEILINDYLKQTEQEYHVRIIHAIESGSRAWGFASPDSDYDVRFIYARSLDDYLNLAPSQDFINAILDDVLDINGWDIKKVLQHIHKSNANIFEWINSPIVYKTSDLMQTLRSVSLNYFSDKSALYHYYGTAKNNFENFLKDDFVKYKKYFYVLRPILACQWILKNHCPPPVPFQNLLDAFEDEPIKHEIVSLREKKMTMVEAQKGPRLARLNEYIAQQLDRLQPMIHDIHEDRDRDWNPLNAVFKNAIFAL